MDPGHDEPPPEGTTGPGGLPRSATIPILQRSVSEVAQPTFSKTASETCLPGRLEALSSEGSQDLPDLLPPDAPNLSSGLWGCRPIARSEEHVGAETGREVDPQPLSSSCPTDSYLTINPHPQGGPSPDHRPTRRTTFKERKASFLDSMLRSMSSTRHKLQNRRAHSKDHKGSKDQSKEGHGRDCKHCKEALSKKEPVHTRNCRHCKDQGKAVPSQDYREGREQSNDMCTVLENTTTKDKDIAVSKCRAVRPSSLYSSSGSLVCDAVSQHCEPCDSGLPSPRYSAGGKSPCEAEDCDHPLPTLPPDDHMGGPAGAGSETHCHCDRHDKDCGRKQTSKHKKTFEKFRRYISSLNLSKPKSFKRREQEFTER